MPICIFYDIDSFRWLQKCSWDIISTGLWDTAAELGTSTSKDNWTASSPNLHGYFTYLVAVAANFGNFLAKFHAYDHLLQGLLIIVSKLRG